MEILKKIGGDHSFFYSMTTESGFPLNPSDDVKSTCNLDYSNNVIFQGIST